MTKTWVIIAAQDQKGRTVYWTGDAWHLVKGEAKGFTDAAQATLEARRRFPSIRYTYGSMVR